MTFRSFAMIGVVLCIAACSSNNTVQSDDEFNPKNDASTGADSGMSSFCSDYCKVIAEKGSGCSTYNNNGHCTTNCAYYYKTVCKPEWQAFATCVTLSPGIECIAQDAGFPILSTVGCISEGDTFHQCITDKDAGFCPY